MLSQRLEKLLLAVSAVAILLACDCLETSETESDPIFDVSGGCAKDTDCKGDRICKKSRCVEPKAGTRLMPQEADDGDDEEGQEPPSTPKPRGDTSPQGKACPEEGGFCELADGRTGTCTDGYCKSPCGPGLFLYGGTHCAKKCSGPADCPGGACEENICTPLCPPACPYKWGG